MKKYFVLIICLLLVVFVGCENKKEQKNQKEDITEKITNNLYTDDKRLVYDNNGIYKLVFYYADDTITGLEHYYIYADTTAAKEQYEKDKEQYKYNTSIKEITLKGKYIIYTMAEDEYKDKTVNEIKDNFSYLIPVYKR